MDSHVRSVRSYNKTPAIQVPEPPDYISPFLSLPPPNSANLGASHLMTSSPGSLLDSSSPTSASVLGSPSNMLGNLSGSSSQPRLIHARQSEIQKLEERFKRMEEFLGNLGFDSIGEFLQILFYNPTRAAGKDPRGVAHGLAIARFLQGKTTIKMSDIIILIYSHKHSAPSSRSTQYHERHAPFSPSISAADIKHARPSLFTWATNLIGNQVHQEIHKLTAKDNDAHLRASTNGRRSEDGVNLVTWEALGKFSIGGLCEKYKTRAPVCWYLTESMAALHKNGAVITKICRPHPIVCISLKIAGQSYLPVYFRSKLGLLARLYLHETITQMEILRWPWAYGTSRRNPILTSNGFIADSEIL